MRQKAPKPKRVPVAYVPPYKNELEGKSNRVLREFNMASKPIEDIQRIPWDDILAIKISESGSTKVLFIETSSGSVVLKTSGEIGLDCFMNRFALCIQVPCPQMRIIKYQDQEMADMTRLIREQAYNDEVLIHRIYQKFNVAFIEVMEYIPGLALGYLGPKKAPLAFTSSENGKERLIKLGITLAYDIFINNCDRYPLPIWGNYGNPENLLLRYKVNPDMKSSDMCNPNNLDLEMQNFIAIDHRMVLKAAQGSTDMQNKILEKYVSNVETYLKNVIFEVEASLKSEQVSWKCLTSIKNLVSELTLHELDNSSLSLLAQGLINGLINICDFGIDRLKTVCESVKLPYDLDWCGNYNENLERIHFEFSESMIEMFLRVLDGHEQLKETCTIFPWDQDLFEELTNQ